MSNKTKKKKVTYFENYDLYSDANPKDTIRVHYKTLKELKETIKNLEKIYKEGKYTHVRIVQVANVLKQRLRVINTEDKRYKLIEKYFDFLKSRTKEKSQEKRKKLKFN